MAAENGGTSYALPAVSWNVTEPPPADPPHWDKLAGCLNSSQEKTYDRYSRRIASKCVDVPLHPFERSALVEERCVEVAILRDLIASKKTVQTKTVLYRHVDHTPIRRMHHGIARVRLRVPQGIPPSMNLDHDW